MKTWFSATTKRSPTEFHPKKTLPPILSLHPVELINRYNQDLKAKPHLTFFHPFCFSWNPWSNIVGVRQSREHEKELTYSLDGGIKHIGVHSIETTNLCVEWYKVGHRTWACFTSGSIHIIRLHRSIQPLEFVCLEFHNKKKRCFYFDCFTFILQLISINCTGLHNYVFRAVSFLHLQLRKSIFTASQGESADVDPRW